MHTARAYHTQILQHKWTKNFYTLSIDGKLVPHKITIYHHWINHLFTLQGAERKIEKQQVLNQE